MKEVFKRLFIKLTSSKVLITITAMVLLYIIVIGNRTEFKEIGYIMSLVVPCYFGVNAYQHKVENKDEK